MGTQAVKQSRIHFDTLVLALYFGYEVEQPKWTEEEQKFINYMNELLSQAEKRRESVHGKYVLNQAKGFIDAFYMQRLYYEKPKLYSELNGIYIKIHDIVHNTNF